MKSRKFQFFSTRDELIQDLDIVKKKMDLVFCASDCNESLLGECRIANNDAKQIYIYERGLAPKNVRELFLCGGIQVDFGAQFKGGIEMSQMATPNGSLGKIYKEILSSLKEKMIFSLLGRNVVTGAVNAYGDIGITKKVLGLQKEGFVLRQRGVENVIFYAE